MPVPAAFPPPIAGLGKTRIQPACVSDNEAWEAVALVADGSLVLARLHGSLASLVPATISCRSPIASLTVWCLRRAEALASEYLEIGLCNAQLENLAMEAVQL